MRENHSKLERFVAAILILVGVGSFITIFTGRNVFDLTPAIVSLVCIVLLIPLERRIRRLDTAHRRKLATAWPTRVAASQGGQDVDWVRSAVGANGALYLFDDRVKLVKSGFRAMVGVGYGAGSKEIALSQITAIQWRDAGSMVVGFIAFSFLGGSDPSGGVFDAVKSENAVTFEKHQQPAFEAIRATVQGQIGRSSTPGPTGAPSAADAIRELAGLRDAGHISESEYEQKKAELLRRM